MWSILSQFQANPNDYRLIIISDLTAALQLDAQDWTCRAQGCQWLSDGQIQQQWRTSHICWLDFRMLWGVNDPAISPCSLMSYTYFWHHLSTAGPKGERPMAQWSIPENISCPLHCSARCHLGIYIRWSKGHTSHQHNGSLCSSGEVIYILLHIQLLTIWKVECGWMLWKTWAVNSNNKDEIPSYFKASINVTKNSQPKKSKLTLTLFNFLSWGTYQKGYSESAVKIKDSQWDEIISSARALSKANHKLPSSAELIVIDSHEVVQDLNPCANLVEDSDSEQE